MHTALKTSTYAVMHFLVAVTVAYALSRSWAIALSIGLVEPLVQTGFCAIHERVWATVPERLGPFRTGRTHGALAKVR